MRCYCEDFTEAVQEKADVVPREAASKQIVCVKDCEGKISGT